MSESPRLVNPWIIAIAVMFATFMEVLDTTVVNVSLPHIASSLSATTDEATWALTSYLVANAMSQGLTCFCVTRFRNSECRIQNAETDGTLEPSAFCILNSELPCVDSGNH